MEETSPSLPILDVETIRSRANELEELIRNRREDGMKMNVDVLADCTLHLESKAKQIVADYSDVDFLSTEDYDTYLEEIKKELDSVQSESSMIAVECERLWETQAEASNRLERDLQGLLCTLDYKDLQSAKEGSLCHTYRVDQRKQKLKILELDCQIEKNTSILNTVEELNAKCQRLDVVEQIEDATTCIKVTEYSGNYIKLSLETHIPNLAGQQNVEDISEPTELNHELVLELAEGTTELMNLEMLPNDVYIGDIVEAAKSFRKISLQPTGLDRCSSLEWVVANVELRIILNTLKRLIVKSANKSRYSFEYLDRDDKIIAHLVGGLDAIIDVSGGWPQFTKPLNLLSIKNSDHHSKGISLILLCKVEELANSLDVQTRQNLTSFVDAVERILKEQMRVFEDPSEK